ncbi:MAG: MarR family transcriptional regulator [Burkholderiales bacterium]|nr:MarR family transcriptional regulator [Burkholderiales bacterium]
MQSDQRNTPSALEDHLGFWLRFVSNHVTQRFQALLADKGISVTEWVALRTLFEQESGSHLNLIDALGMTKGAASKIVTRLEEKALAQRRAVPNSGREQEIVLTALGRSLVPELAALADQNDAHFFGDLAPAQRELLMASLQHIVKQHQLKIFPLS